MSHLHISDGILPWWLWIGGMVCTGLLTLLALLKLRKQRRLLSQVAIMAALGLAAMNIPLGLLVHINLSALAGILLGPLNGFLATFIMLVFNALIGHGGLTVLGVNALLVGSEALVAGALFRGLGADKGLLPRVAVSVLIALVVSSLLVVAVTGAAGLGLEALAHQHEEHGGEGHETVFLKTLLPLYAPLLAIWVAVELGVSLLVTAYINKVRGDVFAGR
ncbi:MAG: hypothetical protein GX065_00905 [Firmicutes bacterium]|nr:hypothetical protein [Bacillota bacterium]